MKTFIKPHAGLCAALSVFAGLALQASSLALTVTSDQDNGPSEALKANSLRWAIANTPAGGVVDFSSAMNGKTINLKGGQLVVDKALTIVGRGVNSLTVSGNNVSRVFYVSGVGPGPGAAVTISDLTITKGNGVGPDLSGSGNGSNGGAVHNVGNLQLLRVSVTNSKAPLGSGGGIYNRGALNALTDSTVSYNTAGQNGGGIFDEQDMTIIRSAITNNSAVDGGGIQEAGTAVYVNSTIAANSAAGSGGGINDQGFATLSTYNVTIAENSAARGGGLAGVTVLPAGWALRNTIIGDNTAATGPDVSKPYVDNIKFSFGNNLIENTSGIAANSFVASDRLGLDPKLGPLQNNGGPTLTKALLPGSPAIDKGSDSNLLAGMTTDQRGFMVRIINGGISPTVDIGAYEYTSARGLKNEAIADLTPCLSPSTDCKTRNRAAQAILFIQRSLTPSLWVGTTNLTACGELVFEQEEKAAYVLQKVLKDSSDVGCVQAATYALQDMVLADEQLARAAIAAAVAANGKADRIKDANNELVAAQSYLAKGDYKGAIEHYEHAWEKAQEAQGIKEDDDACKVLTDQWADQGDGDDDDDCD